MLQDGFKCQNFAAGARHIAGQGGHHNTDSDKRHTSITGGLFQNLSVLVLRLQGRKSATTVY